MCLTDADIAALMEFVDAHGMRALQEAASAEGERRRAASSDLVPRDCVVRRGGGDEVQEIHDHG